jgi:hypothetical protein
MARTRETKVTFYMSKEQKAELEKKAQDAGLSVLNYLRSLLGWPLEQQGARKDLSGESLTYSNKQRKNE